MLKEFTSNDVKSYSEFIAIIISSRGRFGIPREEYKERHHIIPKCMGGNDDENNLIDLYAKEHFYAHKMLYEENKNTEYSSKLACALHFTSVQRHSNLNEKLTTVETKAGYHWYTNGIKDVCTKYCPEGFYPGRKGGWKWKEENNDNV